MYNESKGTAINLATGIQQNLTQHIIERLDGIIGSSTEVVGRQTAIADRLFGARPTAQEEKNGVTSGGLAGEIGSRLDLIIKIINEAHNQIDRLNNI